MLNADTVRSARLNLLRRSQNLRAANFDVPVSREFTLEEIAAGAPEEQIVPWLEENLGEFINGSCVYCISVDNLETAERVWEDFGDLLPPAQRGFKASRRNTNHDMTSVLYVGSSEGIRRRLKEHLWEASASTYALNMHRWVQGRAGSVTVRVQTVLNPQNRQLTQDLEDALWDSHRPLFGKRGGR